MRYLLSILLLFLVTDIYSQKDNSVPVTDFTMYGYINGQRLDSLNSSYAEFFVNLSDRINFDYGQRKITGKSSIITDANGNPLSFPNNLAAFVLNFLHYNHWDLVSFDNNHYIVRK